MKTILLAAVALGAVVSTNVQASAITFAGLDDGTLLNGLSNPLPAYPLLSSIDGAGAFGAMICDTSSGSDCTEDDGSGDDLDLLTPNPAGHASNTTALGNAVVISRFGDANRDGIAEVINDADPAQAGSGSDVNSLTFTFAQELPLASLLFLDRETGETLDIFLDGSETPVFSSPSGPGNASVELIPINATATSLTVEFGGAGGVAQINMVPIPAALPLFATALGGFVVLGWRKRRVCAAHGSERVE